MRSPRLRLTSAGKQQHLYVCLCVCEGLSCIPRSGPGSFVRIIVKFHHEHTRPQAHTHAETLTDANSQISAGQTDVEGF